MSAVRLPDRSDLDVEIDRLWHCMASATDAETKLMYGRRFTDAVNARNAARSPAEIAEIEQSKGLR